MTDVTTLDTFEIFDLFEDDITEDDLLDVFDEETLYDELDYNTDFDKLKITEFPKTKLEDSPSLFAPLEHYRSWCGDAFYMYTIVGERIQFNKNEYTIPGLTERGTFMSETDFYDIYSYCSYKYVNVNDSDFNYITSKYTYQQMTPTSYWYGYDVKVDPSTGQRKYFMPLLDNKMMVNKINIKLELRYKMWKKEDIIRMWCALFAIMSVKIPAKIGFCNKLTQKDVNIPIEIAHIIYEFARDEY